MLITSNISYRLLLFTMVIKLWLFYYGYCYLLCLISLFNKTILVIITVLQLVHHSTIDSTSGGSTETSPRASRHWRPVLSPSACAAVVECWCSQRLAFAALPGTTATAQAPFNHRPSM